VASSSRILSAPLLGEYNPNLIGIPLPPGLQFFQEFGMFICKIVRLSRIFFYIIKMPFPGALGSCNGYSLVISLPHPFAVQHLAANEGILPINLIFFASEDRLEGFSA